MKRAGDTRPEPGSPTWTIAAALEIALAVLVLGMAAWTIAARETFAAVVGFVAYGLLLALVWVRLDAVDVALTEAAIGGLSGILLVGAAARLRASETPAVAESPEGMLRVAAAVLATIVAAALAAGVLALPDPVPTLAPAVAANIAATGLGNPVTGVLMAFRAMDTLLEKVVLLLALVGVWSLAPDRVWGGRPGPRHQADPLGVLAFLARLLPPVGIVVGIYVFWVGADHPGGAFQGGTILAAMWLLVMTAGLSEGENSQVYPPLARVPSALFGICVASTGGSIYAAGDADYEFSIMSVSKPFVFALVCQVQARRWCVKDWG
jgi:multisubunit Na+/H+ antiporter MnhB subunit